jgi:hypothetical protein
MVFKPIKEVATKTGQAQDVEVNPDNFNIFLNVKHWSGCWGGTVVKASVRNPFRYVVSAAQKNEWLSQFLRNSDPGKIKLETVSHTENGRKEDLSGQEYITRVQLRGSGIDGHNLVIVTCINGKPAVSMPEYNHLEVGGGLFQGYRLERGRARYTLTLPYTRTTERLYDHTSFDEIQKTIIASHLFAVSGNLSTIRPVLTTVLIYDPVKQHQHTRIYKQIRAIAL